MALAVFPGASPTATRNVSTLQRTGCERRVVSGALVIPGSSPCAAASLSEGAAASLADNTGVTPAGMASPSSGSRGLMPCSRIGS